MKTFSGLLVLLFAGALLAACNAADPGLPTPTPAAPATPTRPPVATPPVEPVPEPVTPPGVVGEVPAEMMAALIDETAALAQVGLDEVSVERAEAVTWSDGSLGCPEPDQMYTQALVDGFWVVLEAAGQTYDWRMGHAGLPRLCPPGQGQPPFEGLPD